MPEPRHAVGKAGEEAAVQYLCQQGYQILERNYRCRFGEIDLIARDGRTLAFIEVKTRRSQKFGPAAAAVTLEKQRHLIKASQVYLIQQRKAYELCRFDVVTIELDAQKPRIELIKDAFQPTSD
ncbi:MAG: YraN family protein [Candidatus Entotheonellia bacterium]